MVSEGPVGLKLKVRGAISIFRGKETSGYDFERLGAETKLETKLDAKWKMRFKMPDGKNGGRML